MIDKLWYFVACAFENQKFCVVNKPLAFIPQVQSTNDVSTHHEVEIIFWILPSVLVKQMTGWNWVSMIDFCLHHFYWKVARKEFFNCHFDHLQSNLRRRNMLFVGSKATWHHPNFIYVGRCSVKLQFIVAFLLLQLTDAYVGAKQIYYFCSCLRWVLLE